MFVFSIHFSTKEILKAITSSTITTVVVFLPLGFVGGITGEFFLPFALTIVFSLLMSLLVAVTIVPILAKFSFKKVPSEEKEGALQRVYGQVIAWALNHKAVILLISVVLLVSSFALVPKLGFVFLPNEEQKTLVASIELPSSTSLEKTNDVSLKIEKMVETFQQLGLAMVVAIGLVYVTMLITFGKARIPFIILSSLIFVPIGSLLGLYAANEPMSVSVMIGLLMLIGIVTTNAIVLVDRIGQNREQKGMTIRDALIEAGKTRLRPILMTAFATVAALIPLALTKASGTLISKGLAITVISGLTSSTLLTLVIVPVMYELFFIGQVKSERNQ